MYVWMDILSYPSWCRGQSPLPGPLPKRGVDNGGKGQQLKGVRGTKLMEDFFLPESRVNKVQAR